MKRQYIHQIEQYISYLLPQSQVQIISHFKMQCQLITSQ
jgi:hypothetical protein